MHSQVHGPEVAIPSILRTFDRIGRRDGDRVRSLDQMRSVKPRLSAHMLFAAHPTGTAGQVPIDGQENNMHRFLIPTAFAGATLIAPLAIRANDHRDKRYYDRDGRHYHSWNNRKIALTACTWVSSAANIASLINHL